MVSERPDVFMFGEWIYSHPTGAPSVEFANLWGMSLLDFGLCMAIRGALGGNDPSGFQLVARCERGHATARTRAHSERARHPLSLRSWRRCARTTSASSTVNAWRWWGAARSSESGMKRVLSRSNTSTPTPGRAGWRSIKYVVIRENAGAEPPLARYLGRVSAWHPPRTGRLVSIVASPRHRFEMRACASGGIGVPSI
jgi:hypothetical protein